VFKSVAAEDSRV